MMICPMCQIDDCSCHSYEADNPAVISDDGFTHELLKLIDAGNVTDEQIARKFGASRPTIQRWKDGSNRPHPALRPAIIEWLREQSRDNQSTPPTGKFSESEYFEDPSKVFAYAETNGRATVVDANGVERFSFSIPTKDLPWLDD